MLPIDILLTIVFPSLGTIMASTMFSAPINSLKAAIAKGNLDELNPTPWAWMTGNCLGWVAYAVTTQDLFVLFSNAPGLVLSIWLNMGAAKLQYQQMHRNCLMNEGSNSLHLNVESEGEDENEECESVDYDEVDPMTSSSNAISTNLSLPAFTPHEKLLIRIVLVWMTTLSLVCFLPLEPGQQSNIIGLVVNINLVVFYGAPLSTIAKVLSTKNSSSIHRRTMIMSLFNSFFWLGYGVALMDAVIFIPNACGFALGIIQFLLCMIFSRDNIGVDEIPQSENDFAAQGAVVNSDIV